MDYNVNMLYYIISYIYIYINININIYMYIHVYGIYIYIYMYICFMSVYFVTLLYYMIFAGCPGAAPP